MVAPYSHALGVNAFRATLASPALNDGRLLVLQQGVIQRFDHQSLKAQIAVRCEVAKRHPSALVDANLYGLQILRGSARGRHAG